MNRVVADEASVELYLAQRPLEIVARGQRLAASDPLRVTPSDGVLLRLKRAEAKHVLGVQLVTGGRIAVPQDDVEVEVVAQGHEGTWTRRRRSDDGPTCWRFFLTRPGEYELRVTRSGRLVVTKDVTVEGEVTLPVELPR